MENALTQGQEDFNRLHAITHAARLGIASKVAYSDGVWLSRRGRVDDGEVPREMFDASRLANLFRNQSRLEGMSEVINLPAGQ